MTKLPRNPDGTFVKGARLPLSECKSKTLTMCHYCGKEFVALTKNIRRGWGKYCSWSCSTSALVKGKNNPNYRGDNRLTREEARARAIARHPEKHEARLQLAKAVASGRVMRMPCCVCGNPRSEGHHEDYSKPLDVIWLCRKHHTPRHRAERFGRTLPKKGEIVRKDGVAVYAINGAPAVIPIDAQKHP